MPISRLYFLLSGRLPSFALPFLCSPLLFAGLSFSAHSPRPTLVPSFPSLGTFSLAGSRRARFAAHPFSMFNHLPRIRCARHSFPPSRVSAHFLSQGLNTPGLQRILFRCLEGVNCQVKCNTFAILVQTSLPVFCSLALSLVCYLFSLRFVFIVVFS